MKKITRYMLFAIALLSGIMILVYGFSYAKYISNSTWNHYLESKGFYFTSDYLGDDIRNVDTLWDGGSVSFNLKNSLNGNNVTAFDIGYKVECTIEGDLASTATCNINDTSSNIYEGVLSSYKACNNYTEDGVDVSSYDEATCTSSNYIWTNVEATRDLAFTLVSSNNDTINDAIVDITVTSTSPYEKALTGTFVLHKATINTTDVKMDYKAGTSYDRLIITNPGTTNKCMKLTFNADNLHVDYDSNNMVSYVLDSNNYINEIKFSIQAQDSISYIFYKQDTTTHTTNDFTLVDADGC